MGGIVPAVLPPPLDGLGEDALVIPARGRRTFVMVTTVLVIAAMVLVPVMAFLTSASGFLDDGEVKTDPQALAAWERVVGPVLDDLDAMPALEGLEPRGSARISGCSVDSGETFGISAGRYWEGGVPYEGEPHPVITPANVRNFEKVVTHLRARGWTLVGSRRQMDPNEPSVEYGRVADLEQSVGERSVTAGVQAFMGDTVTVSLAFDHSPPGCDAEPLGD